jgi:Holliday junction resolvase RusA-like endonuclease
MTTSATDSFKTNGCGTASTSRPWHAPELDSPAQRAKWERAAAKPSVIRLQFHGEPAPQGSKQVSRWGGLREVSKKIQPWRASIQYASAAQYKGDPIAEPVALDVTFVLPRGKSHYGTGRNAEKLKGSAPRHHTKTPDLDKLCRALCDGLTVKCGGNVLIDDSCVVELKSAKRYQKDASEPVGALCTIRIMR